MAEKTDGKTGRVLRLLLVQKAFKASAGIYREAGIRQNDMEPPINNNGTTTAQQRSPKRGRTASSNTPQPPTFTMFTTSNNNNNGNNHNLHQRNHSPSYFSGTSPYGSPGSSSPSFGNHLPQLLHQPGSRSNSPPNRSNRLFSSVSLLPPHPGMVSAPYNHSARRQSFASSPRTKLNPSPYNKSSSIPDIGDDSKILLRRTVGGLHGAGGGEHLCAICRSEAEEVDTLSHFLMQGLLLHDKILYFVLRDEMPETFLARKSPVDELLGTSEEDDDDYGSEDDTSDTHSNTNNNSPIKDGESQPQQHSQQQQRSQQHQQQPQQSNTDTDTETDMETEEEDIEPDEIKEGEGEGKIPLLVLERVDRLCRAGSPVVPNIGRRFSLARSRAGLHDVVEARTSFDGGSIMNIVGGGGGGGGGSVTVTPTATTTTATISTANPGRDNESGGLRLPSDLHSVIRKGQLHILPIDPLPFCDFDGLLSGTFLYICISCISVYLLYLYICILFYICISYTSYLSIVFRSEEDLALKDGFRALRIIMEPRWFPCMYILLQYL